MLSTPLIVKKEQQPGDVRRIRNGIDEIFRPTSRTATGYFDLANSVLAAAQDGDRIILTDVVGDTAGTALTISHAIALEAEGFTVRPTDSYNYAIRAGLLSAGNLTISNLRGDGNSDAVTLTGGNRGEVFSALIYDGDLTILGDCHFWGSAVSDDSHNFFADCRCLHMPDGIRLQDPGHANIRLQCLTANVQGLLSDIGLSHSKQLRHMVTNHSNNYLRLEVDAAPSGAGWSVGDTLTGQTSSQAVTIKEKHSDTLYTVASIGTPSFTDGEILSNGTDSVDCGTGFPSVTFLQMIRLANTVWESRLTDNVAAVVDNTYPVDELHFDGLIVREPGRNTDITNAVLKVEGANRLIMRDVKHEAPSMPHDTKFLNISGVGTTILDGVETPGTLYCPNNTTDVFLKNVHLGKDSTIDNVFTDRSGHRVDGMLYMENCLFDNLKDNALATSSPASTQKIRGKNVTFRFNDSSSWFVLTSVNDTHHFAIDGLTVENVGSGGAFLSNSSAKRQAMSNEGVPGRMRHGWKTYNDGGSVLLGTQTTGDQHPTPGADSDAFSGITAFEGDTIDDGQGQSWVADSNGDFVKQFAGHLSTVTTAVGATLGSLETFTVSASDSGNARLQVYAAGITDLYDGTGTNLRMQFPASGDIECYRDVDLNSNDLKDVNSIAVADGGGIVGTDDVVQIYESDGATLGELRAGTFLAGSSVLVQIDANGAGSGQAVVKCGTSSVAYTELSRYGLNLGSTPISFAAGPAHTATRDIYIGRKAANQLAISTDAGKNTGASVWAGHYVMQERSSDPANPDAGESVIWQSDGTGSGDDGDWMVKISDSGGTTKTTTLIDFSAI